MFKTVLTILIAAAVGILQASFVRSLPHPFDAANLPLIMILGLVGAFRRRDALLAAVASGLAVDALSSWPAGTETLLTLGVTVVAVALFTRIFTHQSWPGTVGLNAAAFLLSRAAYSAAGELRGLFAGMPHDLFPDAAGLASLFSGLGIQVLLVILLLAVTSTVRRAFSRRFVLLR